MLRTPTVMTIERVMRSMLKRRYLLSNGTARDVGGMISARSKKKTVRERRIEIQRVTLKMLFANRIRLKEDMVNLLSGISWKVKYEDGEEGDPDTWND